MASLSTSWVVIFGIHPWVATYDYDEDVMAIKVKIPFQKSKYKSIHTKIDDINFSSKLEGRYYTHLKNLQSKGVVTFFLLQVPFRLPGGVKYLLDFMVFYADGNIEYVDVKGVVTAIYKLKKKQVEALYPIKIKEIFKI